MSIDFDQCRCKQHYACFGCRKAFKAGDEFVSAPGGSRRRVVTCPECGEPMRAMGLLFRAPPKRAVKAWRGLAELAARSPTPPFQEPRDREPEGACPKCGSRAGLVDGHCPYCGYSRRTASGGRSAAKDYARGKRKRKKA
jgi:DNA-directed RNA polymerase subunit RPC12/RpoP